MKRLFIILALVILTGGFTISYFLYNKPHVNVSEGKIDLSTTVDTIAQHFQTDPATAGAKYADKIILLSGKFHSASHGGAKNLTIIIKGSNSLANCELDSLHVKNIPSFEINDDISVKGLFVGYDDLLGEIQLKKCLVIQ